MLEMVVFMEEPRRVVRISWISYLLLVYILTFKLIFGHSNIYHEIKQLFFFPQSTSSQRKNGAQQI